jgi:hypothetical protein
VCVWVCVHERVGGCVLVCVWLCVCGLSACACAFVSVGVCVWVCVGMCE